MERSNLPKRFDAVISRDPDVFVLGIRCSFNFGVGKVNRADARQLHECIWRFDRGGCGGQPMGMMGHALGA